jgi:hypothetical protein
MSSSSAFIAARPLPAHQLRRDVLPNSTRPASSLTTRHHVSLTTRAFGRKTNDQIS